MKNVNISLLYFCLALFLGACGGGSDDTGGVDVPVDNTPSPEVPAPETPIDSTNILFILSDDQGLDASGQYALSNDVPNTPTLNALAEQGLVFENTWATPACTTTRGAIITGKHGVNSGVTKVPDTLSQDHQILQQYLKSNENSQAYQSAVFGKWHLSSGGNSETHPNDVGLEHYAGNLANIDDYFDWPLTINGETQMSSQYHSSHITDLAIDWIDEQINQAAPWFAWVAYSAPHSPFHLPPESLHERSLSGTADDINSNKRAYYLAAIEAMDSEIGRLIASLPDEVREKTLIIFMGDNGTPQGVIDTNAYQGSHSKGSLYQGGVAVPLVVSGHGVTRFNERESALINATDLYATIAEVAGINATQIYDSHSFKSLLTTEGAVSEDYTYTQFESEQVTGWAVRSAEYKLIEYNNGEQELYYLGNDFSESDELLHHNEAEYISQAQTLENVAHLITGEHNDSPIDITNAILSNTSQNCADYVEAFTSSVSDIHNATIFYGDLVIEVVGEKCIFKTNAIPNHDFNDGGNAFPNDVSEQNDQFEITTTPVISAQSTAISLQTDNAIMLNGVKVDLLAAGCFGIGNGKVGCNDMDQPWRYDPMHLPNGFQVDSHNAHAQPDGTYHYHGSPMALFDDSDSQGSPVVGFAADGFPIFGSYFDDEGVIRKAQSSYRLKAGNRPSGNNDPGGSYDGAFRDDYEYVEGLGDLDRCNGMMKNGVYGYYITQSYPYVLSCFSGTPDPSFNK